MMTDKRYEAVVIGGSAGSMEVLMALMPLLPDDLFLPIIITVHLSRGDEGQLPGILASKTSLKVKEAEDKEQIRPGVLYVSPADYHLLVEMDGTFSLSVDSKVNYARPSIDVIFQSAAYTWGEQLVGIILTGANFDGAEGIRGIEKYGGYTIAQDPSSAVYPVMPKAAIDTGAVKQVLNVRDIGLFIQKINRTIIDTKPG